PIGTVTLTENTATADLGDPPPVDEDGALRNARGRPPYTRFIKKWHDRAWYLGDPNFPWRVWYSEQDEMESVGPLNFIDLRGRESVTGLNFTEDQLIVQGLRVVYLLHGYDESDFVLRKSSSSIGCISHWTNRHLDDIPWWAGPRGAYMYTGSFRYLMRDMGRQWRADYAAAPAIFEKA